MEWTNDRLNMANNITSKMLNKIRECAYLNEKEKSLPDVPITENKEMNFIEETNYLMSRVEKKSLNESEDTNRKEFVITKTTPQFGDVYTSQVEAIKKCVGEGIEFGEKAVVYYPDNNELSINGKIQSINVVFQFRSSDPSGDGVYIWANGSQLTDANLRIIGKIRDAFANWKTSIIQSDDLLDKMKKVSEK